MREASLEPPSPPARALSKSPALRAATAPLSESMFQSESRPRVRPFARPARPWAGSLWKARRGRKCVMPPLLQLLCWADGLYRRRAAEPVQPDPTRHPKSWPWPPASARAAGRVRRAECMRECGWPSRGLFLYRKGYNLSFFPRPSARSAKLHGCSGIAENSPRSSRKFRISAS